ncbi:dicarboxylate/amino acid:cation symporter [Botrimarina mediterranea]|uniref:C4-dicarboxylate transport protein n=1 Tax=Botrimarina mediterranea TaxID=2528022 RepID=A0A518K4H7_9BACT|nr:dicarboxylate/amino acid:cation symporter [Botrimarina mediterranea]QDV72701.1 C4-dicarboxylate transport protein [Botrimarina mediterranea]QDV77273.1 C4-dicarboxylate transport protein [Planctomycetes bacterium K2D]
MSNATKPAGLLGRWNAIPLYWRILLAMVVGVMTGLVLGNRAEVLEIPSKVILQLLGALAPPLILVAVTHVLMTTEVRGRLAARLFWLLILNTTVAIVVGLTVANVMRPGEWSKLDPPAEAGAGAGHEGPDPVDLLVQNVPKSILGPLGDKQNIIGVIIIAVAFGIALRSEKDRPLANVRDFVEVAYAVLLKMLHWIIQLVPLGVWAIVAKVIGVEGFAPFAAMGAFVLAVCLALLIQSVWYFTRIKLFSWARPLDVLRGVRDALVMAFSTDSSTATMPVTYACLKDNVGLREESASMGALVGANFNNDGTALYEAMAALFVAQLIGQDLTLSQQLIVVLTSIIASVGAAGIPEAGLVTMTLVFSAVGLPVSYIALLLTVDWFLDRCRTTINVLGDVNVACLLDGPTPPTIQATSIQADEGNRTGG